MSAFYVGQRVKKVRGMFNVGKAGTYMGAASLDPDDDRDCYIRTEDVCIEYYLEGDIAGVAGPGVIGLACSYEWEPILPPGLESIEEINALFEPSPIEARA